jgi:hypothetical protein
MGVLSCKMKKSKLILILIAGLITVGGYVALSSSPSEDFSLTGEAKATVYRSPSCGCCRNYVGYLKRNGLEVEDVETDDMNTIKEEHSIPDDMLSCHTTMIDGYVVEGHMPLEAIEKLLVEKPDTRGIAMPGMPSGSPGMPGLRSGDFSVYSLLSDGETSLFVKI